MANVTKHTDCTRQESDLKMKEKILITGANGFIGTFLVKEALNRNLEVYAAVRKNSNIQALQDFGCNILQIDYNNLLELSDLLKKYQFEFIIHNAGLTKSPDPSELMRVNKGLLVALTDAIRLSQTRIKKLTFVSSIASYGPADNIPDGIIRDTSKPNPVTHYGVSKLGAENHLKGLNDIPFIIIRPTAVYGPGEKDLLNVFKMVNKYIDIQPGLMSHKLTFIYVKDLANLIISATISEKVNKGYFATDGNVYTSEAFSGFIKENLKKRALKVRIPIFILKGLAFMTEKMAGLWDSYPIFNVDKVNELKAKNWNCDVSNLYPDLGFKAAYDLTKGIPETINWYKENRWL